MNGDSSLLILRAIIGCRESQLKLSISLSKYRQPTKGSKEFNQISLWIFNACFSNNRTAQRTCNCYIVTDKLDWFANVRISSLQKKTISVSNSVEKSLYSTSDLICIIVRCISDLWYNYTVFTMLKRRVFRISFQISNDVVHTTRNLYTVAIVKALTNIIVKYYIINFF